MLHINSVKKIIISKHSKDLVIYSLSTAISKAIPFLLIILLSKYFGPKNFGILSMIQIVISMIGIVQAGPISAAIGKQFFHVGREQFQSYFSTAVNYNFLIGIICILTGIVFSHYILAALNITRFEFVVAILCASFQSLLSCVIIIFQMSNDPKKYLYSQSVFSVLNLVLVMLLYCFKSLSVTNFFLCQLASYVVAGVLSLKLVKGVSQYYFHINLSHLKHLVSYSLPIILYSINSFLIVMYLRYSMKDILSLYALGIFALAQQVGMIMENCEQIVAKVWTPYAFKLLSKNQINLFFKSSLVSILALFGMFIILLVANKVLYHYFISSHFQSGYYCSLIILFAFFVKSLYAIFAVYNYYFEKMYYTAAINVFIGVSSIFLSRILLKHFGMIGGAYSMLLSYITLFILVFFTVVLLSLRQKMYRK